MWGGSQTRHVMNNPYRLITSVFELYRREPAYFSFLQQIFQICIIGSP